MRLLLLCLISLSCQAQTDTVDHYFPFLTTGEGKIEGAYSWKRPLRRDDTIYYKLIVDDPRRMVTVRNDSLGITYKLALILDSAYAVWKIGDPNFGDYWEMHEPFKNRRIMDLNIKVLKIDEYPKPKSPGFIWTQ